MRTITQRIRAIAELAPRCGTVADIGCDHGYLCAELLASGKADKAIACDVSEAALAKARTLLRASFPPERFECRRGDGLRVLSPGEAGVLVITGMGGMRIQRILSEGSRAARGPWMVLGPQKNLEETRRFLYENGYRVERETVVEEAGFFYPLLLVRAGTPPEVDDDFWFFFGRGLLEERPACLGKYLDREAAAGEEGRQSARPPSARPRPAD